MQDSNKKYITSDIGLSSYLMLKGCKLISASRGTRGYVIEFDNSDGNCEALAMEYMNSDFIRYDMYSKNIRLVLKNQKS